MMPPVDKAIDPFCDAIQQMVSRGRTHPVRARAWERFVSRGWPNKKSEPFTYVPLRHLYALDYRMAEPSSMDRHAIEQYILAECKNSVLVFIDGNFSEELSSLPYSVTTVSLGDAEKGSYASFIQRRNQQRLDQEEDPFVLLTLSMDQQGVFVFVPPHLELKAPIQCLFISTTAQAASFPKIQVAIGAHSTVSWISTSAYLGDIASVFSSSVIDVALDESSKFQHTVSIDSPKGSWEFYAMRASLKKNSRLDCKNLVTGGKNSRQDYRITLLGEGADAIVTGLSWLDHDQQAHAHVIVDHQAPSCTSNQFFKGVLSGVSRSSFTGKILVRQQAQKTQAYQLNNNLLLTEGTIVNSKPGLEILADDVKASHGATVSQLDEDQLFYLKTRGLSHAVATQMLVLGFCKDVVDKIGCDDLQKEILLSIKKYVKQHNI